jgi:hypothetical protein
MTVDEIGEIQVQLPDGHVDVVRIDTEAGMQTFRRLFQPLAIRALQRDGFEQNHHHQVQSPHLYTHHNILSYILSSQETCIYTHIDRERDGTAINHKRERAESIIS